ncbi:HID1-like protein 1, possible Golgi protein (by similarity) [Schizosaccharomyces osmophilus]|uniref:HID1-like protein 1, possible Golgi protein By similarity n=1 Tax=Schizosaccharomyces osmophilus TaxID=2545709 RepID=A0AAF0AUM0_9SCHI|nr:HID1-like protein 1, possible Golgi protein (by similarity) [Schizosaccharomyces osmophilus]WBW71030.1 HID1-like protein 1, possible Golgi protein (by similarity) [Schizosaccharomyces osmophilus]
MGSQQSLLQLKNATLRLTEETNIPKADRLWESFWSLPGSLEEVLEHISYNDVRNALSKAPENIYTLVSILFKKLITLQRYSEFSTNANDLATRHVLNSMRVLIRLIPILFESPAGIHWFNQYMWSEQENGIPRGVNIMDTITNYLFLTNFTIPPIDEVSNGVRYCIWESGIACQSPLNKEANLMANSVEVLRLLLALFSETLYTGNNRSSFCCSYVAAHPNKRLTLCLICSLLNTTMRFNTLCWKPEFVPSNQFPLRMSLIENSLSVLLVILSETRFECLPGFHINAQGDNLRPINQFSSLLSTLHSITDFRIIIDGISRVLYPFMQSDIPKKESLVMYDYYPMILLLSRLIIQFNKEFCLYLIETDCATDLFIFLIYLSFEYVEDSATISHLRLCAFLIKRLLSERIFCYKLNKRFQQQATLPTNMRIPFRDGSFADFTVIAFSILLQSMKDEQWDVMEIISASLCHLSLYMKEINHSASKSVLSIFQAASQPGFLVANENNYIILCNIVGAISNMLQSHYSVNPFLTYTLVTYCHYVETLSMYSFGDIMKLRESSPTVQSLYWSRDGKTFSSRSFDAILFTAFRMIKEPQKPEYAGKTWKEGESNFASVVSDSKLKDEKEQLRKNSKPGSMTANAGHSVSRSGSARLRPRLHQKLAEDLNTLKHQETKFDYKKPTKKLLTHAVDYEFKPTQQWWDSWWSKMNIQPLLNVVTALRQPLNGMKQRNCSTCEILSTIRNQKFSRVTKPSVPMYHDGLWKKRQLESSQAFVWTLIYDLDRPERQGQGIWTNTNVNSGAQTATKTG